MLQARPRRLLAIALALRPSRTGTDVAIRARLRAASRVRAGARDRRAGGCGGLGRPPQGAEQRDLEDDAL